MDNGQDVYVVNLGLEVRGFHRKNNPGWSQFQMPSGSSIPCLCLLHSVPPSCVADLIDLPARLHHLFSKWLQSPIQALSNYITPQASYCCNLFGKAAIRRVGFGFFLVKLSDDSRLKFGSTVELACIILMILNSDGEDDSELSIRRELQRVWADMGSAILLPEDDAASGEDHVGDASHGSTERNPRASAESLDRLGCLILPADDAAESSDRLGRLILPADDSAESSVRFGCLILPADEEVGKPMITQLRGPCNWVVGVNVGDWFSSGLDRQAQVLICNALAVVESLTTGIKRALSLKLGSASSHESKDCILAAALLGLAPSCVRRTANSLKMNGWVPVVNSARSVMSKACKRRAKVDSEEVLITTTVR